LRLLILGKTRVRTFWLPAAGELTVGRGDESDVQVDDESVSRNHVVLRVGDSASVEDRGSLNGTFVRGERIKPFEPVAIPVGEVFLVGSVSLALHRAVVAEGTRRIWPHGYFEGRLEEECERSKRSGVSFCVLRVRCATAADELAQETLSSLLRPYDVVGCYGPHEYEVLLADSTRPGGDAVVARLGDALRGAGGEASVGLASFPGDGSNAYELIDNASPDAAARAVSSPIAPPPVVEPMAQLDSVIGQVAASTINVLILGETGVGKEVMAERIHRLSPRSEQPLLRLSCAALPESLLESELFGHRRGAFTGAVDHKQGLLASAHGGTVFLDEIGELPMSVQVKLLRVLEERKVLPLGSVAPVSIDVRFIAATNRELEAEVERGAFRKDLYYRLNGFSFVIPPLRDRVGEIEALATHFAAEASKRAGRDRPPAIAAAAMEKLVSYRWPGNIRELRNAIERAVVLCGDGAIDPEQLPIEKMNIALRIRRTGRRPAPPLPAALASSGAVPPAVDEDETIPVALKRNAESIERRRIVDALDRTAGNQTSAAKLLGISRRTLVSRLTRYGLPRPRKGRKHRS
jgi:DNA-binding NtrC family response regulator